MPTFERSSVLPVSAEAAFAWHSRPGAFSRLTPPWEPARLVEHTGGIHDGARAVIELRMGPARLHWIAVHDRYIEGRRFRDVQMHGPFKRWEHTHLIEPIDSQSCRLTDAIEYEVPGGALGRCFSRGFIEKKLERMFAYRHAVTISDLGAHDKTRGQPPLTIAISGASGMIGSSLVPFLTSGGHGVRQMIRPQTSATSGVPCIPWNPESGQLDATTLEDIDAVVHLGGVSLASARWTPKHKAAVLQSRVKSTRLIAETVARMRRRPRVLVCASGVGFYGDHGAEPLDETRGSGEGFLADVCRQWEAAAQPAVDAGVRVVFARMGIVLSLNGGALASMHPAFTFGLGARFGAGTQFWSCVSLDDVIGALHHTLIGEDIRGPVNVVAPDAMSQSQFTQTLARVMHRPALFSIPARLAHIALGEFADEAMLLSTRAVPSRLLATGYDFRHPRVELALRHLLGLQG